MSIIVISLICWILPYLASSDFICVNNNVSNYLYASDSIRYKSVVYATLQNNRNGIETHNVVNQSVNIFEKRKNIDTIDTFKLLNSFTSLFVPRFVRNHNILLLEFYVPQETREVLLMLYANNVGENCGPKKVEFVLKPHGYPTSNITVPENFIENNNNAIHVSFLSNNFIPPIRIPDPTSGDWYIRVYQTWSRSDNENLGSCPMFISGEIMASPRSPITIVDCYNIIQLTFTTNLENIQTDFFKCYINTEDLKFSLDLSMNLNENIDFAVLSLQGIKVNGINENPQLQCAVMNDGKPNQNVTLKFSPFVEKWHFFSVIYGNSSLYPSLESIPLCKNVEYPQLPEVQVNSLSRLTYSSLFSFDYVIENNANGNFELLPDRLYTFKYHISSSRDTGGVMSIITHLKETNNAVVVVTCIGRNRIIAANSEKMCQHDSITGEPNITIGNYIHYNNSKAVHIPYPEIGTWYLTLRVYHESSRVMRNKNVTLQTPSQSGISISLKVSSSSCSIMNCGPYGSCMIATSVNSVYSVCRCTYGFTGWLCTDDMFATIQGVYVILLLTLSNLFFIPSVVFAIRRKYYTEALVYFFTMFFSSFYHACDAADPNYGLCIAQYDLLQFIDYYCGILSFWVTLVAMASLNKMWVSLLHIAGAVLIAFGTKYDRFSIALYVVPITCGVLIFIISWGVRCKRNGKLFPRKKYLVYFFPIGVVMSAVGLVCFVFIQTDSNYYIVHSIWHTTVALSVLFLLPIRSSLTSEDNNDSENPFDAVLESSY